jgi:nucleoid DNA-binding protein
MAKVNDFARELSEKYGLSLGDASDFVSAMFDVVKEELDGADSSVKIKGFGTFKVSAVGARASVDVNTGERIIIDGRNKISFTPEVLLRDRVNRPFVQFETVVLNDGVDFSEIDEESEEELDSVIETEPQGVQLSPTAPTSQPTDQPTLSEQPQEVQLSPTAPTSQPADQLTDQPTLSEQPQGVQLSSTAPTDQSTDQPAPAEQPQGVQLSSTAPTDQSTDQPAPAEQPQGVQLSSTAPTSQSTDQPTDQSANPQSPSATASKAVNTEEHRDMARRLMTPKTETIEEDSEESDDKTTATAPEVDDEGIVIGGCRQRSPRIMYVLTIASFLILVSLGIGMYFRLLADFGTINSIVCCDMQIVEVCRAFVILRIEGIASVCRRCYFYSFADELSLFQSLLCPCTCVEIACLLDKEVERNHAEFQRSTTTEEQYRVAFWHLQEFLDESNCLINNRLKIFCTMANLSQRKT